MSQKINYPSLLKYHASEYGGQCCDKGDMSCILGKFVQSEIMGEEPLGKNAKLSCIINYFRYLSYPYYLSYLHLLQIINIQVFNHHTGYYHWSQLDCSIICHILNQLEMSHCCQQKGDSLMGFQEKHFTDLCMEDCGVARPFQVEVEEWPCVLSPTILPWKKPNCFFSKSKTKASVQRFSAILQLSPVQPFSPSDQLHLCSQLQLTAVLQYPGFPLDHAFGVFGA